MASYRALFFDLDGTLLPIDMDDFLPGYFHALGAYVARFGVGSDDFMAGMNAGIEEMCKHEDGLMNADAYWRGFFAHVDPSACDWDKELEYFYEHEFGKLGKDVVPNPAANRSIKTLAAKGYPLVLATMPMFPRRAVEWRLTWAGVDPNYFARIATYENCTSVKPKKAYFAENLAACNVRGEDVLMTGNNTVEDLSANKLGADTYLVTDNLVDTIDLDLSQVKNGSLEEFADWACELPNCDNPATDIDDGLIDAAATACVLDAIED